jgi:hypothetical protein
MAKKGLKVSTLAKLVEVESSVKAEKLTFKELQFSLDDSSKLTEMLRNNTDVLLTITVEPEAEGFPAIQSKGMLKKCESHITCQAPAFTGLRFSTDQCAKLIGYIRAETEITVSIEQPQGELFGEDQKPDGAED